jgi:hypothetical protein
MMAPLPNPTPGARPDLPRVRFDVRTAAGRVVGHEFAGDEFLIGAAAGCDLRLTGPGRAGGRGAVHPPPGRRARPPGRRPRRRSTAPRLPTTAVLLGHADTVEVGGLAIGVHIPSQIAPEPAVEYLSPKLVSLDDVPLAEAVA